MMPLAGPPEPEPRTYGTFQPRNGNYAPQPSGPPGSGPPFSYTEPYGPFPPFQPFHPYYMYPYHDPRRNSGYWFGNPYPHSQLGWPPAAEYLYRMVDPAGGSHNWKWLLERQRVNDTIQLESKLNLKSPETFDGKDWSKLKGWMSELENYFTAKPNTYREDSSKITFASTYLTGPALTHYTNCRCAEPNAPTFSSWIAFCREMALMFGHHNPQSYAQQKLEDIKMGSSESFSSFITRFHDVLLDCEYNDSAMCSSLKRALSYQLVERLSHMPEAETYSQMVYQCITVNSRYWDWDAELKRRKAGWQNRSTTSTNSTEKGRALSTIPEEYGDTHQDYQAGEGAENQGELDHNNAMSMIPTDIFEATREFLQLETDLDNDAQLSLRTITDRERAERHRKGQCLFCADPNHMVRECPKLKAKENQGIRFISDGSKLNFSSHYSKN
jgi:hypothetical protein